MDGRHSPSRIAEILRELQADVVALQEVLSIEGRHPHRDQARYFSEELGLHLKVGANRTMQGGLYGNVILSRLPLVGGANHDLSVEGREKRGCIRADVDLGNGRLLHLFNVHLGTSLRERRHQGRALIDPRVIENPDLTGPRVVLGDFNDWTQGLAAQFLAARLSSVDIRTHLNRSRTYPGLLPLIHLDHIYFDDTLELERLVLHRTRRTLMASDHLPLMADFRILGPATAQERNGGDVQVAPRGAASA
jgi:endonuclease/exonuclease/phosphatase family metal-dependent hydrolase